MAALDQLGYRDGTRCKYPYEVYARKMTGVIKWINETRRFGLVTPDDGGDDLFAVFSESQASGELSELKITQRISFDLESGRHGGRAVNVQSIVPSSL